MAQKKKFTILSTIKEWYTTTYPTDSMGHDINPTITFCNLLNALSGQEQKGDVNVYDMLGVEDSLVRERVFEQLAKVSKLDYDIIYNLWLWGNTERPNHEQAFEQLTKSIRKAM